MVDAPFHASRATRVSASDIVPRRAGRSNRMQPPWWSWRLRPATSNAKPRGGRHDSLNVDDK